MSTFNPSATPFNYPPSGAYAQPPTSIYSPPGLAAPSHMPSHMQQSSSSQTLTSPTNQMCVSPSPAPPSPSGLNASPMDLMNLTSEQLQQLFIQKKKQEEAQLVQRREDALELWKESQMTSDEWNLSANPSQDCHLLFVNRQRCDLPYSLSFTNQPKLNQTETFHYTLTITEDKSGLSAVLSQYAQRTVRFDANSGEWITVTPSPSAVNVPASSSSSYSSSSSLAAASSRPAYYPGAPAMQAPAQHAANYSHASRRSQPLPFSSTDQSKPSVAQPISVSTQTADNRRVELRKEHSLKFPFFLNGKLFEQVKANAVSLV